MTWKMITNILSRIKLKIDMINIRLVERWFNFYLNLENIELLDINNSSEEHP